MINWKKVERLLLDAHQRDLESEERDYLREAHEDSKKRYNAALNRASQRRKDVED